jgi:aminoglycoside/choline kinase family phosphotransferase
MRIIKEFLKGSEFENFDIELASADASFRRYFRLSKDDLSYIVMDSSLEKESLKPFVEVTKKLLDANVDAPNIYLKNLEQGFLVLEDFGSVDLLSTLDDHNFKEFYKLAIDEIIKMQKASVESLPLYDKEFLLKEMSLMQEWFLDGYIKDISYDHSMIKESLETIADEVLKQPQGYFVHRDFHSRNIMVKADGTLGVIDYQDAMNGSLTYDLVSLLRDLYIKFDKQEIENLALYFKNIVKPDVSDDEFIRWFDFMGLQRHIKVLGIFARLYLRDGKDGYLKDLPLTLEYVLEVSSKYKETQKLYNFLKTVELK